MPGYDERRSVEFDDDDDDAGERGSDDFTERVRMAKALPPTPVGPDTTHRPVEEHHHPESRRRASAKLPPPPPHIAANR